MLFGSRATRTARADSDVDLVLVIDDGADGLWAATTARRSLGVHATPVDVLVVHNSETAALKRSSCSVIGGALREGRVVYARAA